MSLSKLLENDQSLALLTTLADNSFDSVLITDRSKAGKIIYVNKAFQTLTGFSSKEAVGQTPRILQGPATDKKVITRLANALQRGGKFEGKAINYKKRQNAIHNALAGRSGEKQGQSRSLGCNPEGRNGSLINPQPFFDLRATQ